MVLLLHSPIPNPSSGERYSHSVDRLIAAGKEALQQLVDEESRLPPDEREKAASIADLLNPGHLRFVQLLCVRSNPNLNPNLPLFDG